MYIGTLPPSVGATTVVFPVATCTTCTSAFDTGKSIGVREARYPPSLMTFAIREYVRLSSIVGSRSMT